MRLPIQLPGLAAEPPSDFVADDGGGGKSGKKKILVGLGIGCAGFLLIAGILTAVGAFKAASCCGDLQRLGLGAQQGAKDAQAFGEKLHKQDWSGAHAMFTPAFQKEMSADKLKATLAPHAAYLQGTPLVERVQIPQKRVDSASDSKAQQPDLKAKNVHATLRFFPADPVKTPEALVIKIKMEILKSEDESVKLGVAAIEGVMKRPVTLKNERPARVVLKMHGALQSGDRERAIREMMPNFQMQQGAEKFDKFIDDQGDLFTASTIDIRDVSYPEAGAARVVAQLDSKSGKRAVVVYGLRAPFPGKWFVEGFSPMVQTDTTKHTKPTPANNTTGGAVNGATNSATNGATNGAVKAPDVKPDVKPAAKPK